MAQPGRNKAGVRLKDVKEVQRTTRAQKNNNLFSAGTIRLAGLPGAR